MRLEWGGEWWFEGGKGWDGQGKGVEGGVGWVGKR